MIQEIEIANFRAFSKPVTVRLRPITILVGKNSAGKSTLVKLLLLLRQSLESSGKGFSGDFFSTEGVHVSLGAFRYLQNRNPGFSGKRLRLRLRLRTLEGPSALMLQFLETLKSRGAGVANGIDLAPANGHAADKVSNEETIFEIQTEVLYPKPDIGKHVVTAIQGGRKLFEFKSHSLKDVRFLSFPSNTARPEGELEAMARNTFLRPARDVLAEPRHLSPVRQEPPRVMENSSPPSDEVGHHGEFAIQHLYEILNKGGDKAEFVTRSIRAIARIDELEFKARAREFRSHFQGRNMETGAHCHLNDFGFGVSQCIPIVVQGALLQKGQLLMVEQPEAQLHPTAQLDLGSFFADLWLQFGVPSLVETHSDNLVLRIRKLVAKERLAPEDVSLAYFSVENRTLTVKNLDIKEDGRLQEGLPMDFFGADLLEALDMDAGLPVS